MDKYLIINADDFGMCHSANLAVFELLEKGCISSSTIMTPCCWAKEAARWAIAHPQYAIGAHLTTTSEWGTYRWTPVNTKETDSLRDSEGYMYAESGDFEENADLDEAEGEIRAQLAKLDALGFKPSHADNHMGSLYGIETGRFELLNMTFDVLSEYGLPFRFPSKFLPGQFDNDTLEVKVDASLIESLFGKFVAYAQGLNIAMPDYLIPGEWNGPQNNSYENYVEYMYELYRNFPEGISETYIHPAVESDELKGITGNWHRRVWEYTLFKDEKFQQHIKDCGIKVINYRDLAKMRAAD